MSEVKIDAAYLSANPLPDHDGSGDKHSRGRVLIIAGSVEVPGAALLAGLGALRSGAGVLQIATCKSNASHLGMAMPEAMIIGCRETCSGEIDPSNSVRLVGLAREADAVSSWVPASSTRHPSRNCEPNSSAVPPSRLSFL